MIKKILKKYFGIGIKNLQHREFWLEKKLSDIKDGSKILDAGAGELQYKKFCDHLVYVSQDFGQYSGEGDGNGLQMNTWDNSRLDIVSDITSIPVPDQSFDTILCVEVLEHIPDPMKAIQEFARIIKPGGVLVLTAPFCSLTHFAPFFFYTGYSKYWYEKILPENGFTITEIDYNGNFFDYLIQEMKRVFQMGHIYVKGNFFSRFILAFFLVVPLSLTLVMLKIYSLLNKKSEEVLCFGIGIVAQKR